MVTDRSTPIFIPAGQYMTVVQAAERRQVMKRTIQQWIDKGWVPCIELPGMGRIINVTDLDTFEPPKPGPKGPRTSPER